jgi:hypothetical protein
MMFDDGKTKLTYAARKLRLRCHETQAQWNDQVTRDFDRKHLEPFDPKVIDAVRAIERLAEILTRAERECR